MSEEMTLTDWENAWGKITKRMGLPHDASAMKVMERYSQSRIDVARLTIALCKGEVEQLIGDTLDHLDDGSVWGRAFLRVCGELKNKCD